MVHKKGKKGTFYEIGKIKLDGKTFSSGGSYLGINPKTKKYGGILYAYPKENKVGTWDGKTKVSASFGREWTSNMGDTRQTIDFKFKGKKFRGTYYKSGSDIVKFRQVS